MAPKQRRKSALDSVSTSLPSPPNSASDLPSAMRFALALIINLSLSALLYTLASNFVAGDLATASKTNTSWLEVGALLSCRVLEIGIAWWGDYDGYDIAALTVLSRFPPLFLLTTHYLVAPTTVLTSLLIDVTTTYIPFTLLRSTAVVHSTSQPRGSIANRAVINDLSTQVLISALSAGAYALVYNIYCWTFLPGFLAVNFEGLLDIGPVYNAQFIGQFLAFIPLGVAAKTFLFTPSIGARADKWDREMKEFDPVQATLGQTIVWNAWGFSVRDRTLIERTVVLMLVVSASTFVGVSATVEGVEWFGAAIWASIWTSGAALTGAFLFWVGQVEEVKN